MNIILQIRLIEDALLEEIGIHELSHILPMPSRILVFVDYPIFSIFYRKVVFIRYEI